MRKAGRSKIYSAHISKKTQQEKAAEKQMKQEEAEQRGAIAKKNCRKNSERHEKN